MKTSNRNIGTRSHSESTHLLGLFLYVYIVGCIPMRLVHHRQRQCKAENKGNCQQQY